MLKMPRTSKKKRIKELAEKGWSAEQIAQELRLKQTYVESILKEEKQEQKEINSVDDIKLDIPEEQQKEQQKIEAIKIEEKDISNLKQGQTETIDLTKLDVTQTVDTSQDDLNKLRKALAKNITTFEKAIFRAITDKQLPQDEEEVLFISWQQVMNHYVKDTNQEGIIVIVMLLTAHAGIIALHKDEIIAGLRRMKQETQKTTNETSSTNEKVFIQTTTQQFTKKPPIAQQQ
jgi:hypothetical protein